MLPLPVPLALTTPTVKRLTGGNIARLWFDGKVSDGPNKGENIYNLVDVIGEPGAQVLSIRGRAILVNPEGEGDASVYVFVNDCPTKDLKMIMLNGVVLVINSVASFSSFTQCFLLPAACRPPKILYFPFSSVHVRPVPRVLLPCASVIVSLCLLAPGLVLLYCRFVEFLVLVFVKCGYVLSPVEAGEELATIPKDGIDVLLVFVGDG